MDQRLARLSGLTRRPRGRYEARGWWGQPPLWARVREVALAAPERVAVTDERGRATYGELWRSALHHAEAMRRSGAGRGDVVLVQLPNWREFVTLAIAAESAAVVLAFCPIQWGLRETVRALGLIRPLMWFTTAAPGRDTERTELIRRALAESAAPPLAVLVRSAGAGVSLETWLAATPAPSAGAAVDGGAGSEPLEIAVTSGSTGEPKGVLHVHDTALAAVDSTIRRQGIDARDVVHVAVPVGHTFGYFYGVRCALQARAAVVLQERWDARRMVELVQAHGVTVSLGPSAFVLDLLRHSGDDPPAFGRLRLFTHGGDSLPEPTVRRAIDTFPFRISRALGMTEFGHVSSTDATTPPARCADSVGSAQPEMELRIADERRVPARTGVEGRILVRGPFLFAGYLTAERVDEDVLDADGFFDTGDLGFLDEDNCLHITGRVKNVIRRGAETIPVALLEDVIATHPGVQHAVVVGAPHTRLGEVPVACVQLHPGTVVSLQDVEALLESQGVTRKFWPADLRIFDQWPIGPTNKIDRRLILARVTADSPPHEP
jgi:cyclohexanecarboxylate-CoA ligase